MSLPNPLPRSAPNTTAPAWRVLGALSVLGALACAQPRTRLPTQPPPAPILADVATVPGTPEQECGRVVEDLRRYSQCELLDRDRRWQMARWVEFVETDLAVARNPTIDEASKKQIAVACHKAALTVGDAAERCAQEAAARGPALAPPR